MREKRHKLPEKKQHTYSMLRFCVFLGQWHFVSKVRKNTTKKKPMHVVCFIVPC